MDSRHESFEQETINQFIELINKYIFQHTEEIVSKDELLENMKSVAKNVYQFSRLSVDVDAILSKKNLLSVDIISLPIINEMILDEKKFTLMVKRINAISAAQEHESEFYKKLNIILSLHHLSPDTKV